MDVVAAVCVSAGILSLGLASRPSPPASSISRLIDQTVANLHRRRTLPRLPGTPRTYWAMSLVARGALFAMGGLQSPFLAVAAGTGGFQRPRLYLAWLVRAQSQRSEAEAPRLL